MGSDVDQRTAALLVFVEEYAPGRNGAATDSGCLCVVDVAERAGLALLLAAMSAKGTSIIGNIEQIARGYEDIDLRLNALGAHITRQ